MAVGPSSGCQHTPPCVPGCVGPSSDCSLHSRSHAVSSRSGSPEAPVHCCHLACGLIHLHRPPRRRDRSLGVMSATNAAARRPSCWFRAVCELGSAGRRPHEVAAKSSQHKRAAHVAMCGNSSPATLKKKKKFFFGLKRKVDVRPFYIREVQCGLRPPFLNRQFIGPHGPCVRGCAGFSIRGAHSPWRERLAVIVTVTNALFFSLPTL